MEHAQDTLHHTTKRGEGRDRGKDASEGNKHKQDDKKTMKRVTLAEDRRADTRRMAALAETYTEGADPWLPKA